MYQMMVLSAIITHVMPYLSSMKVERSVSSMVAAGIPLVSIFGRLGLGWLGDSFDRKLVTVGSFIIMGIGVICFGYNVSSVWMLGLFLLSFSIGYGGCNSLRPALVREYFGRNSFGTIIGVMMGIGAVGSIVGPTLVGWMFDNSGSYQLIWYLFGGLSILPAILILVVRSVRYQT